MPADAPCCYRSATAGDGMSRAPEARETLVEALATATAELHELRTENMRLRHQARETAAIHDRLAAELVTVQGSVDRLLAQCVRQRALLDDLLASLIFGQGPDYVIARINSPTWDALCAIGGES